MSVSVLDLACARGGLPVLTDLTFHVGAGEALVLRGPNGSGKTTLLRTISGLQPPLSGQLETPPEGVAYAGHADGVKGTLTVSENLGFWARVYGTGEIGSALDRFDLADLADRPAQTLSAGQKRRLGLARVVVSGRRVWVMDEPTVSLDGDATAAFARTLRWHLQNGGTAILATHIDLGLDAPSLDLRPYRARLPALSEDWL